MAPKLEDDVGAVVVGGLGPPSVLHPRGRIAAPLPRSARFPRRVVRSVVRLCQGLYYHDAFQSAPAMAFHFFTSLLPLFVFLGYVLALVARRHGVDTVLWPILDALPSTSEGMLKTEVDRLAGAHTLGFFSAVGFLWLASGGTHGLMDSLEMVVGAPRRPWWRKRLLATGWVLGSMLLFVVASWGVVQWDAFVHEPDVGADGGPRAQRPPQPHPPTSTSTDPRSSPPQASEDPKSEHDRGRVMPEHGATVSRSHALHRHAKVLRSSGERVLALMLSVFAAMMALAGFYRFSVSLPKRVKRRVVPGAVLAVFLWILVSWGFGLYVRTLASYALFYGSLTAVAVLLVWLWLTSFAILVGAEWNAQLEGLRD